MYSNTKGGCMAKKMIFVILGAFLINACTLGSRAPVSTAKAPTASQVPMASNTEKPVVATEMPTSTPAALQAAPTAQLDAGKYPWHENIVASVFWVGEPESPDNDFISNESSAWVTDWVGSFGGVDAGDDRNPDNPYYPSGFVPEENPFYLALPAGEYTEDGPIPRAWEKSYWANEAPPSRGSLFKNRWVEIVRQLPDGTQSQCYGQWEDVGPNVEDAYGYVFGNERPNNTFGVGAGIDVSPAMAICLNLGETDVSLVSGTVAWRFVDSDQVPEGPWSQIITTSGPKW
jgi:hypothetical protein